MKYAVRRKLQYDPIIPEKYTLYDFCISKLFEKMNPEGSSWWAWNVILKALSAKALDRKEKYFYSQVTGGLKYRRGEVPQNLCLIIGRKAGKSTTTSRIALYYSFRFDPRKHEVIAGEEPVTLVICPNLKTALIDINFAVGMARANELIEEKIIHENQTKDDAEVLFANQTGIKLVAVTAVTGRGPSTYCLILDEAAYFRKRGQFSDSKIFDDALPGMIRFGEDARYFILSSPGRKDGLLWEYYQRYYGVANDECLVVNGASRNIEFQGKKYYGFNPKLREQDLFKLLQSRGESFFRREILGEFVDSIESAYSETAINKCVALKVTASTISDNFAVCDPAGLSPQSVDSDSYVVGIGHVVSDDRDGIITVTDKIKGWCANPDANPRTTSPKIAIRESIELLHTHKVKQIWIDKFKIEWVKQEYEETGFEVLELPRKNDLYLGLDPALNSTKIKIPNDPIIIQQLKSLERSTGQGEK